MSIFLPSNTRVWTDHGIWPVEKIPSGRFSVYDGFGRKSVVSVSQSIQPLYTLTLDTGQVIGVGAEHSFYVITGEDSRPRRINVQDMSEDEIYYLYMPSRKARLTDGALSPKDITTPDAMYNLMGEAHRLEELLSTYANFEKGDDKPFNFASNFYVKPPSLEHFRRWSEILGFYGIAVVGHMAKNLIEIDPKRPSCFATKLLTGRGIDPEDFINDLLTSHIITPVLPFDDLVKKAVETGIIFEGEGVSHLRMAAKPLNMKVEVPVHRITLEGDCTTIETPWVRT